MSIGAAEEEICRKKLLSALKFGRSGPIEERRGRGHWVELDTTEQMNEDIRQFLIESGENLATLDIEIVKLEKTPENKKLISSVFRTIHTIKGTCGFFGFDLLTATAHIAENILCQVRADQRKMTPDLISLILEAVDKIKLLLVNIEASGTEGEEECADLIARMEQAHKECETPSAKDPSVVTKPAPVEPAAHSSVVAETAPPTLMPILVSTPTPEPEILSPASPERIANAATPHPTESTIRVDVGLLDKLMNLVGELVLARNQLLQDTSSQSVTLQKTSQRLNLITSELQEGVMKTRMQPIGVVWNKLPRIVRDLAQQCGKQIRVEMVGADTELDKTIIEAIKDPLTHIVRNSCDHGIETPAARETRNKDAEGLLLLRAYHEGGVVNIEISDDGAGIDPAKMRSKAVERGLVSEDQAGQMSDRSARELIFSPGFSTAEKVTNISGRGVGMDVVKTNIEKIGGSVEILQGELCGTTIRIRIPLTLAIVPGLIVSLNPISTNPGASTNQLATTTQPARNERFVIPQANLLELVRLEGAKIGERIKNLHGTPIFHYRGKLLPLVYLRKVLGKPVETQFQDVVSIVVLHAEGRHMGLVVDKIHDTQEIVVKPLARQLKGLACYVGATIMGDGLPALILDVAGLARLANLNRPNAKSTQDADRSAAQTAVATQMLLLFRAGSFDRLAIPLALVARLEEVPTNKIERAAGQAVLHYRNDILPLVSLASVLEPGKRHDTFAPETVQVIVFTDGVRRIGVVVDQIVDIIEEAITVRRGSSAPGLLGSAVIGGKITDLLDLHAVVGASGENWLDRADTSGKGRKILLVDSCLTTREMIAEYLGASGYDVVSATAVADALPRMRQSAFDLVVTAVGAERSGDDKSEGFEMLKTLRRDKQFEHLPILGLVEREDQLTHRIPEGLTYNARLVRSRREDLLACVADLVRNEANVLEAVA
jgi:two-component system, chemotaxis family, sensor kinase CheA